MSAHEDQRPTNNRGARLEEVIIVETYEGAGTYANPGRVVVTIYSKAGEVLAVRDPIPEAK